MRNLTTLCYIEKDDQYLMLHRISKKKDINKGKWIGVGGHFEANESPEECLLREVKEETGLTLTSYRLRGLVTFVFSSSESKVSLHDCDDCREAQALQSVAGDLVSDCWKTEYMCLYTADRFEGEMTECDEGELMWIKKRDLEKLTLWEGDKIFLKLLAQEAPFFSLKLRYEEDTLVEAVLDGKSILRR